MIKYGFFNSVNDDRLYNAEDMSEYFDGIISNGVYESIGDKLQVVASGDDMTITIKTGRALIDCHWIKNDSGHNITLSAADVQLSRCDSVGIKLDYNSRDMSFIVVEGPLGRVPTSKRPIDTESVKYLWLADIMVNKGVSVIKQGNIVDKRGTDICPWVTGVIKQVDTSQLFAQWQDACENFYNDMTDKINTYLAEKQADFDEWYNTLSSTLTVDTYIQKYQRSIETVNETNILAIGIPEYNSSKDILFVNINGVEFVENVDYTISGTGETAKINLKNSIEVGNQITFIVLKSKIGSSI